MHERALDYETGELDNVRFITNPENLADRLTDEANFSGGHSELMAEFMPSDTDTLTKGASEIIKKCDENGQSIVVQGGRSSLTGASVPFGDIILNMSRMDRTEIVSDENGTFAIVQPGVTFESLGDELKKQGLFFPPAPTYQLATVAGAISTNAAGARSYKYGQVRDFVEGLRVVLASGEELVIERGQHTAYPGDEESPEGYFLIGGKRVNVPSYMMPDVPKVSAGYYSEKGMDLIDLFIGAEGTLGVITEAKLRVIPEPPTYMALIQCGSDSEAVTLINKFREFEGDKLATKDPGGISAVEYIASPAIDLIRGKALPRQLERSKALLLIQIETDESMAGFFEFCEEAGINTEDDSIIAAEPEDTSIKSGFIDIREAVPHAVNDFIRSRRLTKSGSDPCVNPKDLARMLEIYDEEFTKAGVKFCWWGHGEGNIHYNALPENELEAENSKEAIMRAGERVIVELGGTGTAEHNVGKNRAKQRLLLRLYGAEGIEEMRAVKEALDPNYTLAPGNIFPVEKT